MEELQFEWDPEKARSNLRKHGVTFETAVRVFADPFALVEQDRVENGEYRWQTTGMVDGALVLLVAHADREEGSNRSSPYHFGKAGYESGKKAL